MTSRTSAAISNRKSVTIRLSKTNDNRSKSILKQHATNTHLEMKNQFKESKVKPFGERTTVDQINLLVSKILNQDIFRYSDSQIVTYFLKCLHFRSPKSVRRISKADFLLNKGEKKLDDEMDVVKWVRSRHIIDIM